jgi:hypothetical protein
MVLFRVRRVKSARLDDKRSYHRRGISIHPQRPDPSELPLRDHNAAPRKSMLGGAKLGHNIYLPIRRPLMRAQGSMTNSSGMRISLLLTRGYPMAAESHSIGHEFSCST